MRPGQPSNHPGGVAALLPGVLTEHARVFAAACEFDTENPGPNEKETP